MNRTIPLLKRLTVYVTLFCVTAQPAFAGLTDISLVPLSSSSNASVLPNLMFILDDSGSMDRDYLPDFVNDSRSCLVRSGGNSDCQRGDPPYYAGGATGFNGVYYDPRVNYAPALNANGTTVLAAPLSTTALTPDAFLGGTNVNLTTGMQEREYCNPNGVCKRNGATTADDLLSGTDAAGNSHVAGQFPYTTHKSNASTQIFGLPEMMAAGAFNRAGSTVTVTTVEAHGLTTSNRIFVTGTGVGSMDLTNVTVASVPSTTQFTYTSTASGTENRNGFYRAHSAGTATRSGTTVTIAAAAHGLVVNDRISTFNASTSSVNINDVAVTSVSAGSFTYTSGTSGTISTGQAMTWVRNGLYNDDNNFNTHPVAFTITPVEYCSDVNLVNCVQVIPPAAPPVGFSFPAYVRYCKSQHEAIAPGAVSGSTGSPATPRCQLKYVTGVHQHMRYGWFKRENIKSTVASYTGRPNRTDCAAAPTCTYTEEIQNYARWYTYYRKRMQMMKTAAGRSFIKFISNPGGGKPDSLRVGFITINPLEDDDAAASASNQVQTEKYLKIANFNTVHAADWFTKLYDQQSGPGTPLREALARVGWIYSGKMDQGMTSGIPAADDPVQESCQRNFSLLTTDGYWNGRNGQDLAGNATGDHDNVDNQVIPPYTDFMVARTNGTFDGAVGTSTVVTTTTTRTHTICGEGLTDTCGCSGSGTRRRIRQTDDNSVRTVTFVGGVQTTDVTTTNQSLSTVGSCVAIPPSPTITLSPNPQTFTTTVNNPGPAGNTLADVALYYYKTDLRSTSTGPVTNPSGTNVAANNVPTKVGNKDFVTHQHMVTFTVGIVDGLMRYQPDYETATTGDLANIKNGVTGNCFWASGVCNWPIPQEDQLSALDDLWHAAINGRGQYFSARDPNTLSLGLEGTLQALNAQMAAAAASATSSPNITQTDRQIFSTTYQTDTWAGKIVAQNIDPATGTVDPTILWSADSLLLGKVTASSDTRNILSFDSAATNKIEAFTWANLSAAQQAYFTNKCSPLTNMTQCVGLTPAQLADANNGQRLVEFLRGWTGLEAVSFRDRRQVDPVTGATAQTILGDTINARPQFVRGSTVSYGLDGIPAATHDMFRSSVAGRSPRLYVGANDGYVHAFHGDTGEERWAYLPSFLMPSMYALADTGYSTQHRYYVDGSPEVGDVFDATANAWKTVLVGGLNGGGRGFFALDITNPDSPKGLWEFCHDATLCAINDADLGLSYGNPVIGKRPDGKWVVVLTSGLNNVSPGNGRGYFYVLDAITGALLDKIEADPSAAVGDTTTPSGLMKIAPVYDAANTSGMFRLVYGGDQLGNVWRLDMSASKSTHLASLLDGAGRAQPITTPPVLTKISGDLVLFVGTGRYLGKEDLSDPGAPSGIAWQQSVYAFKENGGADYGTTALRADSRMVQQLISPISPTQRTITNNPVNWTSGDMGWYMDFNPADESPGERVNIDMDLVLGTLVVTTNVPITGGGCTVGGDSWQYQLDYKSGSFLANSPNQVGGQKLGNVITVGIAVIQLPSGAIKGIATGADTGKSTVGVQISSGGAGAKRFSYRER